MSSCTTGMESCCTCIRPLPVSLASAWLRLPGTSRTCSPEASRCLANAAPNIAEHSMPTTRVAGKDRALPPARDGFIEELKLLSDHRNRLVRARTAELGRIHSFMTVLRPGYQTSLGTLKNGKTLSLVIRMLRAENSVRAQLVRESVAEVRRLNQAIARVEQRIEGPLASSGTTLHLGLGIGPTAAAKILGEVGVPAQLGSAAGFARMSGVAPIPGLVREHHPSPTRSRRQSRAQSRDPHDCAHTLPA
jgi:hypothetical protein